jgi:pilus assembly protein TadC
MPSKYLPPLPFPRTQAVSVGKQFAFIGYQLTRINPSLIAMVAQAEMLVDAETYATLSVLSSAFLGALIFGLLTVVLFSVGRPDLLLLGTGLSIVFAGFMLLRNLAYPSYIVRRRVTDIEKNFLYALRHVLIQIKGGSPVFNAVVGVSEASYGGVSDEFRRVVLEINAGTSLTKAMENMALRNPSIYLRRTVWQLVNALRTGADMGVTLTHVVEQFTAEQRVLLEKFGKELAPYAMMYMMVTVIFPTLGITLFLIVSSLSGLRLNQATLVSFLVGSAVVQFFFIQFLKTKRPAVRF